MTAKTSRAGELCSEVMGRRAGGTAIAILDSRSRIEVANQRRDTWNVIDHPETQLRCMHASHEIRINAHFCERWCRGVDPPIQGAAVWSSICPIAHILLAPRVFIEVGKISCPEFVRIKSSRACRTAPHWPMRPHGAYAWPAPPAHKSSHSGYLYHFEDLDCSP